MKVNFSNVLGLNMPKEFNVMRFDGINNKSLIYQDTKPNQRKSFASSWNAIGWRFLTMIECNEFCTQSIKESKTPIPVERYKQEKGLFEFYTCSLTIIENYFYALYCLVSAKNEEIFNFNKSSLRRINPELVTSSIEKNYSQNRLTEILKSCINSNHYLELKEIRDFYSHRGSLSRSSYLGGELNGKTMVPKNPKELGENWQYELEVSEDMTHVKKEWICDIFWTLFENTDTFLIEM